MYYATADEMEKLDEIAVQNGLEIRQMMELAGFHMLEVFRQEEVPTDASIIIAVGKGNKGGDGLSAARYLYNHGYHNVSVVLSTDADELKDDPAHHLRLLNDMGIPVYSYVYDPDAVRFCLKEATVIIDSLIGYHLEGDPRDPIASIIREISETNARVIAYDMPSGVDATSGTCHSPCIMAGATLTLALPKQVFANEQGAAMSGRVYLADIGIPDWMYKRVMDTERPSFSGGVTRIA